MTPSGPLDYDLSGLRSEALSVDALADELLTAINDFPPERPFSRDPVRGEPERRLAEAYNRLYCELHDKDRLGDEDTAWEERSRKR